MNALVHYGAHPGYVKTSLTFAHLQAGQLDEARRIIKVRHTWNNSMHIYF